MGAQSQSEQEEYKKTKNIPLKSFQTAKTVFIQNKLCVITRSIVFFLLASERVWSTKVSQRPLQSAGSSTPTTTKIGRKLDFIHPILGNGGITLLY